MKKSLSLSMLVVCGLILLSIASCGGSSDRQVATAQDQELKQYAKLDTQTPAEEAKEPAAFTAFPVYTDGRSPDNHYIPAGYMGDYGDVKIDQACFDNPHSGTTCIKIDYNNKASNGARWVGVYWQNPANNWGDKKGGYDLTGATKLTFWIRGAKGGERIEEIKMGGLTGQYADSDVAGIGPVLLKTEWTKYEVDLRGKDLSYISGGFCWATNLDMNPDGATFYLDDIRYE